VYYYFLPFILGIISSFSLPPYNFVFLNFLTFPIFLYLLIKINEAKVKWKNFKLGWFFGFGYFLSNIYWIVYSLTFEDNFKIFIPFALILIPSFLALFYGFSTLIIGSFKLKNSFLSILIFALIFSIIEFLRGFILGGFPWNLIVYSLTNYLNSIQILSIIGTYSLNLISITIFLFPLLIFFTKNINLKIFIVISICLILIINNLYGSFKIKNNKKYYSDFKNFKIKVVSPKISIDRFFDNSNKYNIIEELIDLSKTSNSGNTIYVFPEGVLPGVSLNYLNNFKNLFENNFSDKDLIIMGINSEELVNNKILTYNSMVVLDNKLNLLHIYKKNKLVPFGEFLPFEKFLKKFGLKKVTQGYESFSRGNSRKLIFINEHNFSFIPLICYEIIYSGKISIGSKYTNFIINISEDGWFGDSIGPYQHFSHSVFRAIEEGKNVIRSTNNGISAYINANGQIINKIPSTHKGVIEITQYILLKQTFFTKYGNKIFFYFVSIYIILIFLIYKKKGKQ